MSAKYSLDAKNGEKIIELCLVVGASAIVTTLMSVIPQINLPPAYAPFITLMLSGLGKTALEWLKEEQTTLEK